MKDRDIRQRKTIKASEVRVGSVIEVKGQRIRADRRRDGKDGKIRITQHYLGHSQRSRCMVLNPRKHVDLVRR